MALASGTLFASYLIGEPIGAGGMGEVYRATDRNLKRDVALKVLPESFAQDADRLARFQREAEVLAALNHVNIAHIYGLERSGGVTALVMELVDGQTLAERLEHGALPADEALNIALQIAEALEAAHERGIVHRDLKPANIKLASNGVVKVLDFGIAKALDTKTISGPQAAQLTTPAMTEAGIVLGTAAYMSPEQARGKPVDQRADIWAFGCVLYEMLTGQLAFGGEDVTTTLARILERDADLAALPASVAPAVKHTIKLCLEKNVRKRFADIRDVKLALSGVFETPAPHSAGASAVNGRRAWLVAAAAVLSTLALAVPALQHLRETAPPLPPETRVEINTPATSFPDFALSPDGRQLVFVAAGDADQRLWLRSLATTTAQPLPGTERARNPFWSPDSQSIAFFTESGLKRLDLNGGALQTLAPSITTAGSRGSWGSGGTILFSEDVSRPLMQVPATGGVPAVATTLQPLQQQHTAPYFLPDGEHFLFRAPGAANVSGVYLGKLDGTTPVKLLSANTTGAAVYLPSGWLLWVQEEILMAQRLDVAQARLTGEPISLANGVALVSTAMTGLLAYRGAGSRRQLTWVDRAGTVLGTLGEPDGTLRTPAVSPDGTHVIVARDAQNNTDLWLLDGTRESRLTFDAARDELPVWSADGARIAFRSYRTGVGDIYVKPANTAGVEELLVASDQLKVPSSWSADGRFLLYFSISSETSGDLWVLPEDGAQAPSAIQQTPFQEVLGVFSPDGRWVAFQSNVSGRNEIYVRPFAGPDTTASAATAQWQVSTAGGISPLWSPDGSELYYLNPEGDMTAVPITTTETTVEPGTPVALFAAQSYGGGVDIQVGRQYDVTRDGRFLINRVLDEGGEAPIVLIQNWDPEAAR